MEADSVELEDEAQRVVDVLEFGAAQVADQLPQPLGCDCRGLID